MTATPVLLTEPHRVADERPARRTPPNPSHPRSRIRSVNPPDPTSADDSRLTVPLGWATWRARPASAPPPRRRLRPRRRPGPPRRATSRRSGCSTGTTSSGSPPTPRPSSPRWRSSTRCSSSPSTRVVLGGYHASILWREVLRDFPQVDAVIRNEGELPFAALVDGWASGADRPRRPGRRLRPRRRRRDARRAARPGRPGPPRGRRRGVDALPPLHPAPHRAQRPHHRRRQQPGLPERCLVLLHRGDEPPVAGPLGAIAHGRAARALRRRAVRARVFEDANLFVRSRRTVELARAIHALDPSITWSGTATADHIVRHADVLPELARLGCAFLEVGIEAGNDASLDRFNKWTDVEVNERALTLPAAEHIAPASTSSCSSRRWPSPTSSPTTGSSSARTWWARSRRTACSRTCASTPARPPGSGTRSATAFGCRRTASCRSPTTTRPSPACAACSTSTWVATSTPRGGWSAGSTPGRTHPAPCPAPRRPPASGRRCSASACATCRTGCWPRPSSTPTGSPRGDPARARPVLGIAEHLELQAAAESALGSAP